MKGSRQELRLWENISKHVCNLQTGQGREGLSPSKYLTYYGGKAVDSESLKSKQPKTLRSSPYSVSPGRL